MSVALDMGRLRAPPRMRASERVSAGLAIDRAPAPIVLDVIKDEFDRQGGAELNSVQALLLYNIGEGELTAGELKTRGYYLGSNVSYNLKKLVDMGYLHYKRSETDRRSVRVSLTEKGKDACEIVQGLYQRQMRSLEAGRRGQSRRHERTEQSARSSRAVLVGSDPLSPLGFTRGDKPWKRWL